MRQKLFIISLQLIDSAGFGDVGLSHADEADTLLGDKAGWFAGWFLGGVDICDELADELEWFLKGVAGFAHVADGLLLEEVDAWVVIACELKLFREGVTGFTQVEVDWLLDEADGVLDFTADFSDVDGWVDFDPVVDTGWFEVAGAEAGWLLIVEAFSYLGGEGGSSSLSSSSRSTPLESNSLSASLDSEHMSKWPLTSLFGILEKETKKMFH